MDTQSAGGDAKSDPDSRPGRTYVLSSPDATDGASVFNLIAACPPLDQNSMYANLLQCSDFSDTCAIAKEGDKVAGWVSGYIPPKEPNVYFLWQVAVDASARGQKLPKRLVHNILSREACKGVKYIKTTITADNDASWGLFRSIARWLDTPLNESPGFDKDDHFEGAHDSEILVTIGPFDTIPDRV